jgi:hypothetical protein
MKRVLLVLAVLGVAWAWSASSGAASGFKGIVVAKEHGKLLVASNAGAIRAVSGGAAIGARILVTPAGTKVLGHAKVAKVRGVVIRRIGATTFIANNHHVVAVRKARMLAAADPGDVVTAAVRIHDDDLDEDDMDIVGHANSVVIQAQVAAVGTGTVTLLINGTQVPISLPAGLTLPASLVGQMVSLTVKIDNDNVEVEDENEVEHQNNDDDDGDHHGGDHRGHGGGDDGGDDH